MPAAALKSRDPYFDNARALLIVLVVIGHVIEMSSSGAARGLYTWIYAFHMPAFILISGYLARNFSATPKQCARLLASVLVPYLIFDVLHSLVGAAVKGELPEFSPGVPAFTLWFLFALVAWRLMVPLLRVLRRPVLVAVAVSLLSRPRYGYRLRGPGPDAGLPAVLRARAPPDPRGNRTFQDRHPRRAAPARGGLAC